MSVFCCVFVAMLASLGVALGVLELVRIKKAKKASFICLCFDEALLDNALPDMLIICRTDAEQEEIIKRISDGDSRKVYIKRI